MLRWMAAGAEFPCGVLGDAPELGAGEDGWVSGAFY